MPKELFKFYGINSEVAQFDQCVTTIAIGKHAY